MGACAFLFSSILSVRGRPVSLSVSGLASRHRTLASRVLVEMAMVVAAKALEGAELVEVSGSVVTGPWCVRECVESLQSIVAYCSIPKSPPPTAFCRCHVTYSPLRNETRSRNAESLETENRASGKRLRRFSFVIPLGFNSCTERSLTASVKNTQQ